MKLKFFSHLPGQIAANEALKKDLEGIISGLQDYLYGVKDQARQAQSDCLRMQKEKDTLQQLLWDKDQQLNQLLQVAQICENTKEVWQRPFYQCLLNFTEHWIVTKCRKVLTLVYTFVQL